ncbi:hypothetical protein AMECASPLE_025414 [Ameca splendens]|uniref:Uncharacterized protein n=1 Tax=Ameca splendens TaxID=208324 RepID=A0ABV0XTN4_9TELE
MIPSNKPTLPECVMMCHVWCLFLFISPALVLSLPLVQRFDLLIGFTPSVSLQSDPHLSLVPHDYSVPLFIGSPCTLCLYLSSLVFIVPCWFLVLVLSSKWFCHVWYSGLVEACYTPVSVTGPVSQDIKTFLGCIHTWYFWSALNAPEFVSPLGPDLLCR